MNFSRKLTINLLFLVLSIGQIQNIQASQPQTSSWSPRILWAAGSAAAAGLGLIGASFWLENKGIKKIDSLQADEKVAQEKLKAFQAPIHASKFGLISGAYYGAGDVNTLLNAVKDFRVPKGQQPNSPRSSDAAEVKEEGELIDIDKAHADVAFTYEEPDRLYSNRKYVNREPSLYERGKIDLNFKTVSVDNLKTKIHAYNQKYADKVEKAQKDIVRTKNSYLILGALGTISMLSSLIVLAATKK